MRLTLQNVKKVVDGQTQLYGIDLDLDQALVIRCEDGLWKDVTAVPLDSAFERFWA